MLWLILPPAVANFNIFSFKPSTAASNRLLNFALHAEHLVGCNPLLALHFRIWVEPRPICLGLPNFRFIWEVCIAANIIHVCLCWPIASNRSMAKHLAWKQIHNNIKKKLIAKIRECEASLHYPKKTTSAVPGTVNFLVHKVNNKKLPYWSRTTIASKMYWTKLHTSHLSDCTLSFLHRPSISSLSSQEGGHIDMSTTIKE